MNVTYSQMNVHSQMYIYTHRDERKEGRKKGEKNGRKRKIE